MHLLVSGAHPAIGARVFPAGGDVELIEAIADDLELR
jgi:hypothetical protein